MGKLRQLAKIKQVAERKLTQLTAAVTLEFLKSPPGNHLELLVVDRTGQHSIRINQQWRLYFAWTADGPADVEIVDYHCTPSKAKGIEHDHKRNALHTPRRNIAGRLFEAATYERQRFVKGTTRAFRASE